MADASLGKAVLRTQVDNTGLRTGLDAAGRQIEAFGQNAGRNLQDLGRAFTGVGRSLTVGLTLPITGIGVAIVKAASDAEETASKFATVYRAISAGAEEAANRLATSFGLSSTNARRLLGDTGDLLTGFGFTADAALDLSVQVNELAVDLASFTNFSGGAAGASAALTKALLGERESVKSLGISILETDVQARVLLNTQQGLTFESERQAKAYATLQIAQEQSKNAIGDFARTSDSFANQLRILQSRLNDAAVSLGTVLLPAATSAVTAIAGLVTRFSQLNEPAQRLIIVAGGIAAALGPIILVTGSIITNVGTLIVTLPRLAAGFVALKTAVSGFGIAAAGLLGPAGLLIAGAAAVAGLAYAFAGSQSDKTTLTGAVTEASAALASGDAASITGALDKVIAKATGPTRDALVGMQEDLRQTGRVGVEAINDIARALSTIELDTQIAVVQAQIAGLRASLAGRNISASPGRDVEAIFSAANIDPSRFRLDEALNQWVPVIDDLTTSFQAGYDALSDVQYDALLRLNRDWKADTERVTRDVTQVASTQAEIARLYDELARLETARAAALAGVVANVPDAPTTRFAASGVGVSADIRADAARTAADVVRDLGEAGAALNRMAALVGTADAQLAAAEGRFRLIEEAITEIVTDFPEAIGTFYESLRARQANAAAEVDALKAQIVRADADFTALGRIPDDVALTAEQRARANELTSSISGDTFRDTVDASLDAIQAAAEADLVAFGRIADELDLTPEQRARANELTSRISGDTFDGIVASSLDSIAAAAEARLVAFGRIPDDVALTPEQRQRANALTSSISGDTFQRTIDASLDAITQAAEARFLAFGRIADDIPLSAEQRQRANELVSSISGDTLDRTVAASLDAIQQAAEFDFLSLGRIADDLELTAEQRLRANELVSSISGDTFNRTVAESLDRAAQAAEADFLSLGRIADDLELSPELRARANELVSTISGDTFNNIVAASLDAIQQAAEVRFISFGRIAPEDQPLTEAERRLQSDLLGSISGDNLSRAYETLEDNTVSAIVGIADDVNFALQAGARRASNELSLLIERPDLEERLGLVRPSLGSIFGPASGNDFRGIFDESGKQLVSMSERSSAEIRAASEQFALTVINSASTFANAITAFGRGDVGAGISGFGSGIAGIVSAIDPIVGAVIGATTGIFGGLISAGQSQREQDRVRAAGVSPRGAPAIEFNVNVQQSLNVQSLTDPASRAAVNGLLNETVTRITRVIESNVIPRIQRLEAATL